MEDVRVKPTRGFDWNRLRIGFWFQNERTDRVWDAALNEALDVFGVRNVTRHTCDVGPFHVWIANWPYGYGNHYPEWRFSRGLPLVRTRLRLRQMVGQGDRAQEALLGQAIYDACQRFIAARATQGDA